MMRVNLHRFSTEQSRTANLSPTLLCPTEVSYICHAYYVARSGMIRSQIVYESDWYLTKV
jgi:hypothetical protein